MYFSIKHLGFTKIHMTKISLLLPPISILIHLYFYCCFVCWLHSVECTASLSPAMTWWWVFSVAPVPPKTSSRDNCVLYTVKHVVKICFMPCRRNNCYRVYSSSKTHIHFPSVCSIFFLWGHLLSGCIMACLKDFVYYLQQLLICTHIVLVCLVRFRNMWLFLRVLRLQPHKTICWN